MYSDFCNQWKAERGALGGPSLNVVLACQDCEAAVHGYRICRDLFESVNRELDFSFRNAWRFDSLRSSDLRENAIRETICADMVVISAHAPWILPPGAKWWLESALEQREGDPGALVLLLNGIPEGSKTPILPIEAYLAECAQNGGMDLFIRRSPTANQTGFRTGKTCGDISSPSKLRSSLNLVRASRGQNSRNRFTVKFERSPLILPPRHGRFPLARIGKRAHGPAIPAIRMGRSLRFGD